MQAIWLLAQGHTVGCDVEGDGLRPALDRATAGALQYIRPRGLWPTGGGATASSRAC